MQVQVHTDATIQGGDSLETWAHEEINTKLARLKEHVVRVEVNAELATGLAIVPIGGAVWWGVQRAKRHLGHG